MKRKWAKNVRTSFMNGTLTNLTVKWAKHENMNVTVKLQYGSTPMSAMFMSNLP